MLKKTPAILIVYLLLFSCCAYSQSNQQKAQELVSSYISLKSGQNINFNPVQVSRSSYADTKQYKNFVHKVDSLEVVGRKIDARIPKLKTTAEINQSKKDSKNLSNQLVATSNQMIDFMTEYKGQQIGWIIKASYRTKKLVRKKFYLNMELTKVDSVK